MSTFVPHFVAELSQKALPSHSSSVPTSRGVQIAATRSKEALQELFVDVERTQSLDSLRECINSLQRLEQDQLLFSSELADGEETALRQAVLGKVALGLYAHALQILLEEATEAEMELEWWGDLGRSRRKAAYYLVQTLPLRVANLSQVILATLRTRNMPLQFSVFKPSSLRRLFPPTNTLRPNTLTLALFPHLHNESYGVALKRRASRISMLPSPLQAAASASRTFAETLQELALSVGSWATLPIDLAHGECSYKRKELERIRDERAEMLGILVGLRGRLASALESDSDEALYGLGEFIHQVQAVLAREDDAPFPITGPTDVLQSLSTLASITLPSHVSLHRAEVKTSQLKRPARLTLLWPRLVFLPPLALYAVRTAYMSRASLEELAREAVETAKGFWEDWILEPLRGIVRTVRVGRDEGVIVTKESVRADLDSLERMTLALAQERLHYEPAQLDALSRQVQHGDLTAVMQMYEQDIKSPLRSAVQGTLLRSLFIQVQKAKVDINQALSGIDKLLKSQELTFAFVGVAPALAIVYASVGYLRGLWTGGAGRGRYGGKTRRSSVWLTMRRLERLLIAQPSSHHHHQRPHPAQTAAPAAEGGAPSVTPLTSGLLLLSVARLRRYAETALPARSRLREGFLEDVADLEDPRLGRADKLRVLDRMWRSWGEPLGWNHIAA